MIWMCRGMEIRRIMVTKTNHKSAGFTLVELVMVIILIGVLSALGIGLFTRSSAFSPLLATQQLQSATLLAQQAALAGSPSNVVTLSRNTSSGELLLDVGSAYSFAINLEGAEVGHRSSDSASFSLLGSRSIRFDNKGWVNTPGVGRETIEFRISGSSGGTEFYICVSSLGAVYQTASSGNCYG